MRTELFEENDLPRVPCFAGVLSLMVSALVLEELVENILRLDALSAPSGRRNDGSFDRVDGLGACGRGDDWFEEDAAGFSRVDSVKTSVTVGS